MIKTGFVKLISGKTLSICMVQGAAAGSSVIRSDVLATLFTSRIAGRKPVFYYRLAPVLLEKFLKMFW
jgi:hypothetical protein